MTVSNQYYSTIRSAVVVAVTNERNPLSHKCRKLGFSPAMLKQKPSGRKKLIFTVLAAKAEAEARMSGDQKSNHMLFS